MEAYFPMRKPEQRAESKEQRAKMIIRVLSHTSLIQDGRETIEAVYSRLNKGIDMAFLTIGDPAIYSTFFYLYDKLLKLNPELKIEIIPGVSSINASAARAKISLALADEKDCNTSGKLYG